jgi:uncharacterized protein
MGSERDRLHARVVAAVSPRLAQLGERLRGAGVQCGVEQLVVAHEALAAVEPTRATTHAALSCVMCKGPSDLAAFDAAFAEVFGVAPSPTPPPPLKPSDLDRPNPGRTLAAARSPQGARQRRRGVDHRELARRSDTDVDGEPLPSPSPWSPVELLRDKDFSSYTAQDRVVVRHQLRRLADALPTRRSARRRPVPGIGERIDAARTIRAALRSGGDPLELCWLAPDVTHRRLVFVCDLSGSMAPYARVVLEYVHAVTRAGRGVETFCFATTLVRVTRELCDRDPDRAITRAQARLPGRSGGTRIGAAIAALNRGSGRAMGRGAVVVILSDGWDRGEPDLLGQEMARLKRTSHRVLWLDPHYASPGYEPLTRGMREAIPHVDRLLAGGSLRALEGLAATLEHELESSTSRERHRQPG